MSWTTRPSSSPSSPSPERPVLPPLALSPPFTRRKGAPQGAHACGRPLICSRRGKSVGVGAGARAWRPSSRVANIGSALEGAPCGRAPLRGPTVHLSDAQQRSAACALGPKPVLWAPSTQILSLLLFLPTLPSASRRGAFPASLWPPAGCGGPGSLVRRWGKSATGRPWRQRTWPGFGWPPLR